jgi:magnesium-transporting ATPase (P-type)
MLQNKITRIVVTDLTVFVSLLSLSYLLLHFAHLPAAISFIQLVAIELFVIALPLSVIANEKEQKLRRHLNDRQLRYELAIFSALAVAICYANYLLFFVRHSLSAAYIDNSHPAHLQAMTLTLLTLGLCQLTNLLLIRAEGHKKFFTSHLHNNQKLLQALAASALLVSAIIYAPLLQTMLGTAPLDASDISAALLSVGILVGARSLQRHTRSHTRHIILKLHQESGSDI